jgi:hypothetical protein
MSWYYCMRAKDVSDQLCTRQGGSIPLYKQLNKKQWEKMKKKSKVM